MKIKPFYGNENTDGSCPEIELDELIKWGEQAGSLKSGVVMLQGWSYDLRPFLKKYIVKSYYDSLWRETWAGNKKQARALVGDHSKCKVLELDNI